ncbi:DUF4249 family protein [Neolewinella antarctica]|uniref:DUF4249 family protein n=1 Tax=Neolewinella antarctica TaxID=442734 RepID=A0ABX0XAM3_9BACT|nr:DUF4249 family protein [Neolewinella antarctica]NJC26306.1 hypothetical protein [Neolewinella antarctica]
MKHAKIVLLLLGSTLIMACTPDPILVDIAPVEQRVVVFSQVVPEEVMTVVLTNSFGSLDYDEEESDTLTDEFIERLLLADAEVTISYRDRVDTLFPTVDARGFYASAATPLFANEAYELRIRTADDRLVSATSLMLPQVKFTAVQPVILRRETDTLVTVEFEIIDPSEDNRYMINYFVPSADNDSDFTGPFLPVGSERRKTVLLDDAAFTDNVFRGFTELPNVAPDDVLVVALSNISETYYRYLQAQASADNFLALLTQEPVSSPTNVRGGLGFFNTHFPDGRLFNLAEY